MSRIIAGRFDRSVDADAALESLKHEGFARHEVDSFYVSPPGQHATAPIGGDAYADAGARRAGVGAGVGALIGAAVGGLAGWLLASDYGLIVILLAGGLGAYIGSFAGTMIRVRGGERSEATIQHPVEPAGGRMIAILVERPGSEASAIDILRRHGARDVSRAFGEWHDGSWKDFDPRAPLAAI